MASKRRGGFRGPELRGTLGTLLRTTTDVVRDALERGASAGRDALERSASAGRARLDDVRSNRRRQDALAELGDIVLDLIRRGEIDLAELPEARDLVRQLDELDAEDAEPDPPRAVSRRRFDDRPPIDHRPAPRMRDDVDDGTVSSGADRHSRPTTPARPRHHEPDHTRTPTKPIKGLSRHGSDPGLAPDERAPAVPRRSPADRDPRSDREPALARRDRDPGFARPDSEPDLDAEPAPPPRRSSMSLAPDPHRKGGISFDDDDLNEYMHPDDVPPKSSPRDPSDGDA